jgi:pimeloyl-ACP methyl ester carboxylesterase
MLLTHLQRLKQFTTVVEITDDNATIPVPLHFVHHTSHRDDAIPLLFLHGFPGSFLEVINIIDSLTNPPNASLPAFHVVAPSLPGFGFSPAPQQAGVGPVKSAQAFNALMQKLGYPQYVMQGGDFGGMILRYQANMFPKNVITAHSNFWVMMPSEYDIQNLIVGATSEEETAFITTCEAFVNNDNGFRMVQQSKPIQAAYALTDSPLGNCLWLFTLMQLIIDPRDFTWSLDEIITWSLMYYIQGPYGGMRMYKEMLNDGAFIGVDFADLPIVSQPVAISQFPYDALGYGLPLDWARRGGNVVKRFVHDHGGHFAAYEVPDLLLPDIWSWFGDKNASGTSFFD